MELFKFIFLSEIMAKFSKASTIDDLVEIYSPLVNEFDSDIVTIQISSINQEETIKLQVVFSGTI